MSGHETVFTWYVPSEGPFFPNCGLTFFVLTKLFLWVRASNGHEMVSTKYVPSEGPFFANSWLTFLFYKKRQMLLLTCLPMNNSQPFHVFLRCVSLVFFHGLSSDVCVLNCNECICLQLLGWYTPCYFFIASISRALGLHQFYPVRCNKYKDKDEGGEPDIPPHPMETDSVTTWQQDSIVVSRDEAIVGMQQRGSSRHAARKANKAMKLQILAEGGSSKSHVGGAPKR